jgi:hypothetical protein
MSGNVQLRLFSTPKLIVSRLGILMAILKSPEREVFRGKTISAVCAIEWDVL